MQRIAIVNDGHYWYVRLIRLVEHDSTNDEMVYHFNRPIGMRHETLESAVASAKRYLGDGGAK